MSTASCYSITRDSNHIVKFTLFLWWPPRSCRWREDGSRDQELGRLEGRRYYPWLCKILFWCRGFCQVGSHDTFFKLQKYTVLQFLPWNYQRLERFFYWFNRTGNCCNLQISPAHPLQPKIILTLILLSTFWLCLAFSPPHTYCPFFLYSTLARKLYLSDGNPLQIIVYQLKNIVSW